MLNRKAPLGARNTLEARLWARLKLIEGARFRRRATFKTFTLDFVEHDRSLVVDLLEGAPGTPQSFHAVRDRLLSEQGYVILRLWKAEVDSNMSGAIARIRAVLEDL